MRGTNKFILSAFATNSVLPLAELKKEIQEKLIFQAKTLNL